MAQGDTSTVAPSTAPPNPVATGTVVLVALGALFVLGYIATSYQPKQAKRR